MAEKGRSSILSGASRAPLPPCGGARAPFGARRGVNRASYVVEPPSLSLPHKGGGESKAQSLQQMSAVTARILREAGIETAELDARLLLCHAVELSHEAFIARSNEPLAPEAAARLAASLERRTAGEPVSRILGRREFYGRSFLIDRHTLDPRPDTETLIEAALEHAARDRAIRLLDLGTGTGCILITLLSELPLATGIGTDIDQAALALAASNAERLGVADRAAFVAGDWLAPLDDSFDLIVSNPPYIATAEIPSLAPEVRLHDPRLALDGGADGLAAYRHIAGAAARALRPGGSLIVEIGANQADDVCRLFRAAGLSVGEDGLRRDLGGRPRVAIAQGGQKAAEKGGPGTKRGLEKHGLRASFRAAE
jgi:release factor glutamine methyltransferase